MLEYRLSDKSYTNKNLVVNKAKNSNHSGNFGFALSEVQTNGIVAL